MNGATVLIKFVGDTKDVNAKMNGLSKATGSVTKGFIAGSLITKGLSTAFNMISSSAGSAAKRLDTMNNFPKVMSNLGISAKDSKNAINTLSDKLTGLPTALDTAALSVQKLTSKNGDIQKSTDLFLAMNNAILAGGASSEIQNAAMEQLTQAYAKGKPDMQEWRSIQTAMPAQLSQVAKAMGYVDSAMLGEAVRAKGGEQEFARMMDTMMKMNTDGVKGFKSFDEQARNATGGIQTSIANMKTAITRGLANAFDTVDKSLKASGLGGISGVINSIGKAFENVLKAIAPLFPPIIKALGSVFSWLMKNKDTLILLAKIFIPLIAAVKAYNIVIGIKNKLAMLSANGNLKMVKSFISLTGSVIKSTIALAKNVAQWVVSKTVMLAQVVATKAVTAAQWLLNAAMSANPIGLIIAAIVALIAIFVVLWNKCDWFRNFWIGLWEKIKGAFLAVWEALKGAFKAVIDWIKNNWKQILLFLINPFWGAFSYLYKHCTKFRNFINKIVNAIVGFFKSLPEKIKEVPRKIVNFFAKLPDRLWETGKKAVIKLASGIINFAFKVYNKVQEIKNKIIGFFKELPEKMLDIGKNIITGLWNGAKKMKDWVLDKIKGLGKSILKGMKKVLGIKSPSKEFAIIGKFSVLGYTEALDKMKGTVQKQIDSTFGISPTLSNSASTHLSPQVNVVNNINVKQDPLGRMVKDIKTFSGGSKNDYNYGMGV